MRTLLIATFFVFSVFAAQLLRLQAFDATATAQAAMDRRTTIQNIPAMRGKILDTNGRVLAESVERYTVVADPTAVAHYKTKPGKQPTIKEAQASADAVTDILAGPLKVESDALRKKLLTGGTRYVVLAKDVDPAVWRAINAKKLPGISGERTAARIYPLGVSAAGTVGFVTPATQKGSGGVELQFEKQLIGTPGRVVAERGQSGQIIPGSDRVDTQPVDGSNVKLTIDADLQFVAANSLAKQVTKVGAQSGDVVVVETKTGKIRAVASYPTYDPTNLGKATAANMSERAFTESFEPGSTSKVMTFAAALDQGIVKPDDGVLVPNRLSRPGTDFKDYKDHEPWLLTATGVLAKSSNIGTILIGERMTPQTTFDYLRRFGIGQKTASGYPGEQSGILAPPDKWNQVQRNQVLYGQGYSLTSVQEAGFFQAVANNGSRVPLTLVEGTYDAQGRYTPTPAPNPTQVIKPETAKTLSQMMVEVTGEHDTAKPARIAGYEVAGKTGTANRYDEKLKKYDGYTASFSGFAPAVDPKYVVIVIVHKPKVSEYGGDMAGPVFTDVMTYLLQRDGTPPTPERKPLDVFAKRPLSDSDPTVFSDAENRRRGYVK